MVQILPINKRKSVEIFLALRFAVISLVVYALFFVKHAHAEDLKDPRLLQQGEYLSVNYLQRLMTTKSPLAAENGEEINLVVVKKPEKGWEDGVAEDHVLELIPISHFHEGIHGLYQSKNGWIIKVIYFAGSEIENARLIVKAPDVLLLSMANLPFIQYRRLDLDYTLRTIVISGVYVNQSGEHYEFTKSGVAHTPQGDFSYAIGVDHALLNFDYIINTTNHTVFRLVRKGCMLDLYAVSGTHDSGYKDGSMSLWQSLKQKNCATREVDSP